MFQCVSVIVNHQQLIVIPSHSAHINQNRWQFHHLLHLISQSFLSSPYPKHSKPFSKIYLQQSEIVLQQYLNMKVEEQTEQLITIFHFNDVYNIQPEQKQPKAGAAYFDSLFHRQKSKYQHVLTLFSGDAFSPSLLSTQFEGQNMIKPLNSFGIDLACFGNHDLDFELQHVMELVKQTNFPWLLSNVYDKRTQRRLAEGLQSYIFTKNGLKIGVFSLAEYQWIDTLYPYYKQICQYIPFIDFATQMVDKLRNQQKCDMIIALTHMMKYNDIKLAKNVKGIDIILGGHDHLIVHQKINDTILIKSGSDFRNFSVIKIEKKNQQNLKKQPSNSNNVRLQGSNFIFQIELKEVNHQLQKIQPNQQLNDYIVQIYEKFKVKQQKTACFTVNDLDLRFGTIRKQQSPFLQFLVSIYRHQTGADIAMMNSGNFRMDTYVKAGPVTFGVIQNIITDTIALRLCPGNLLIQALQNCVSMYPNLAGRYSAFSGISFTWDGSKKPGERVIYDSIYIHDQKIDLQKIYKIALHSFAAAGGDGYEVFKKCQSIEGYDEKQNRQLLHDLLHINHYLLDSYVPKYPGRFNVIEKQGHKYLQLTLPKPKNVHMILSTGHVYDGH